MMLLRGVPLILLFALLSACGQKGDLYFPKEQAGMQSVHRVII